MAKLKEKLAQTVPGLRNDIKSFVKEHGKKVISEVTVAQAYGGMRGVRALVCDTSVVPPDKGLIIRGIPIGELKDKLPEAVFYLLVTGELPDDEALNDLKKEFQSRANVPDYVWKALEALPKDAHPMVMFSLGILAMEGESVFRKRYTEGIKKEEYWEPILEDCLNLLAKLPNLAAGIYRMRFNKGPRIEPDPKLDWAGNFAHMLGIDDPSGEFANLMRLYMVLHSDHEGGNVSAHTCHCVGSALSDPYYAVSAGLNGLAGPLHGLANQECLRWVIMVKEKFGGVPTEEQLRQFAWDTLNSGQVIPGYGHAVLRVTDPRFTAFHEFGLRVCKDDVLFQIVDKTFQVVPDVLKEHGKAKDPWPNVDAHSGCLLYHFGLTEFEYYTVLFGVSRALGMCAQLIVSRAMGEPIERPKSSTTEWIKQKVAQG
ncbi:type I citrate synthase [candidate division WOR-3 bacterium 4484_100]|uniref:citrate synthase (unknown stereospecificity) n=1 Tax=candidate division WOR-3 bacterium 4484_100 TaxID=1936077 RepID=A0A1V4QG26_UNCW3|nr:MAG: type I citrate synthase [candidate division WOR-3 bacterium 4484_100]